MALTWNPADKHADIVLSNSNLTATCPTGYSVCNVKATIAIPAAGKWYWEVKLDASVSGNHISVGVGTSSAPLNDRIGVSGHGRGYRSHDGEKCSTTCLPYGDSYDVNDIIGIALDTSNNKIWWSKNGVWQDGGDPGAGTGAAYTNASGTYFPMLGLYGSGGDDVATARFDSYDFDYSMPAGFSSLFQSTGLLDGKLTISPKIDLLDGKLTISPKIDLLDGKIQIKDTTTNLLDGKAQVRDTAINLFDGKAILHPILTGDLILPLFNIEATTGPNASLDESLLSFKVEAFTGGVVDLTLPFFNLENTATVGEVAFVDVDLPSLAIEALTGIKGLATLPSLECEGNALVGVGALGEIELPLLQIEGEVLVEILATLEVTLPMLQVSGESVEGIVAIGDVILWPLRLVAEGQVGPLATADISLPFLTVEGNSFHELTGTVDTELPRLSLLARASTLFKDCEILRYNRWE